MILEICELAKTQFMVILFVEALVGGLLICLSIIAIKSLLNRFLGRKKS